MLFRVALVAAVTAVLEIWFMIVVAGRIGWEATLLLLILFSAGGAWIVKREGLLALRRLQGNVRDGHFPTADVVDGFLILAAGALLLPPGFLTGVAGLLLVIPPIRRLAGRYVSGIVRVRVAERISTVNGAASGAAAGWRAYRRPSEPGGSSGPRPSGGAGRTGSAGDVLDVDGEEIDLFGSSSVELGPARSE